MPSRSHLLMLGLLAAMAGCSTDRYAKMLIEQDTGYGKFNESVMCPCRQLVQNKTISADHEITMPDKTVIDAWILKATAKVPHRGTVLLLHGLCDSKASYSHLARLLADRGFDVVLPDLRAHGRSGGTYVTYGALEKLDQKQVMDQLLQEGVVAEPLYVFGANLGGTTALLYAAMDERVDGVVSLGAGQSMMSYCRPFLTRMSPLMNDDEMEAIVARAGKIGSFDPSEASVINVMGHIRAPLVLMHGQVDMVVPSSDSEDLFEASGAKDKQLDILPLQGTPSVLLGLEGQIIEKIEWVASRAEATGTAPAGTVSRLTTTSTAGHCCEAASGFAAPTPARCPDSRSPRAGS